MSSSDAPPAPDYVGAAQAQGAANVEAAIATGRINNPTVTNPYGTQTVSWDGDKPYIVQTLSPQEQYIYNSNAINRATMADIGRGLITSVGNHVVNPLDFTGLQGQFAPDHLQAPAQERLGNGQKYLTDAYNASMSRVNTDVQGQRDNKNSELIAAGIRPGTAAYSAAMQQIDRQYNDARQQAILGASQQAANSFAIDQGARQQQMSDYNTLMQGNSTQFAMDQAARKQAIAEQLTRRQTPINEMTALMSGSQVNNPFASGLGYQAGANVGAAPISNAISSQGQAQQNMYNQQQAGINGNISAGAGLLGSLGGAYLMSGR